MIDNRDVPARGKKERLSPAEMIFEDFVRYVAHENISAEELVEAYYRLGDVFDEGPANARITGILSKMHEMVHAGIPQNRFVKVIDGIREVEQGREHFNEYVSGLGITENEQATLRSIVGRKRSGRLSITISGERESFVDIDIVVPPEVPEGVLAVKLKRKLEEVIKRVPEGKRVEFSFEEA